MYDAYCELEVAVARLHGISAQTAPDEVFPFLNEERLPWSVSP